MSYGHSNWTTDVDNGLHYTDNINNVEYGQNHIQKVQIISG